LISQIILNFLASAMAGLIAIVPDMPPEWDPAIAGVTDFGNTLAATISNYGIVVPFAAIWLVISAYLGVLGFWAAVQVVRLVLWLANR
jgi:hypothetical protein